MTPFWSGRIFSVGIPIVGNILKNPFLVYQNVQIESWFLQDPQEVEPGRWDQGLTGQQLLTQPHAASRSKGLRELLDSVFKLILASWTSFPPFSPTFFFLSSVFFALMFDLTTSGAPFAHSFDLMHQRGNFLHFYRIYFHFVRSVWNVNVNFLFLSFSACVVHVLPCLHVFSHLHIAPWSFSTHWTKH